MDTSTTIRPNGAGAAALLAAALGCFTLGLLTAATDKSAAIKAALILYKPTGALSGVTTLSIALWLLVWIALHLAWKDRDRPLKAVATIAFGLLAASLLLTFPPFLDLF